MNETLTTISCLTPGGKVAHFLTRDTTNDAALVFGIMGEDEYQFGAMAEFSGVALDIGAHIGILTVLLALDNPDLRIIAVEALPDNVRMLRANVDLNGLAKRVEVIEAAATDDSTSEVAITYGYEWVGIEGGTNPVIVDTPYVRDSRYIGNIFQWPEGEQKGKVVTVPGIGLAALLEERGITEVALAKIDIEGGEWAVWRSPAVALVETWIGEYHDNQGLDAVDAMLGATHVVTEVPNAHEGLFLAVRR